MKTESVCIAVIAILATAGAATAHVPYLECRDFTEGAPYEVRSEEQSIAVYSWLESRTDVDVYRVVVRQPTVLFFADCIVPVFPEYGEFRPSFALIGQGLPDPGEPLPVALGPGEGAIVLHDEGTTPRETFYEPFGNKSYYQGPTLEMDIPAGTYRLVYWDPAGNRGDYVAAIGKYEIWGIREIIRALIVTPLIRRGKELHLDEL
jgi:hypothetical protein